MERMYILKCTECGTCMHLERTLRLCKSAPRFCPYCGAEALENYAAQHEGLEAIATALGVDVLLVQLLWQDWSKDDAGHDTLRAYVEAQVNS